MRMKQDNLGAAVRLALCVGAVGLVGSGLAIAQDDQPRRRNALRQHFPAQHRGVKGLQLRMQRGEDGFAFACHQM